MTVASVADITARVTRPLTPGEEAQAAAMLEDIEVEIRRYGPDRLTNPAWIPAVKSVSCAAVIRAMRLPTQLQSVVPSFEGAGFSSTPDTQGAVYLRRSERRTLGFRLNGVVPGTPPRTLPDPDWGFC
jgi:hypothetical protein